MHEMQPLPNHLGLLLELKISSSRERVVAQTLDLLHVGSCFLLVYEMKWLHTVGLCWLATAFDCVGSHRLRITHFLAAAEWGHSQFVDVPRASVSCTASILGVVCIVIMHRIVYFVNLSVISVNLSSSLVCLCCSKWHCLSGVNCCEYGTTFD